MILGLHLCFCECLHFVVAVSFILSRFTQAVETLHFIFQSVYEEFCVCSVKKTTNLRTVDFLFLTTVLKFPGIREVPDQLSLDS